MNIGRRLIGLAGIFIGLNALDTAITIAAMSKGGVAELNPIMRIVLSQPAWIFWYFKISLALLFTLILLIFANKFLRQISRIFIGLVIAMAGICLFNLIGSL